MDEKIDTLLKEGRVIQPTAKTKAAAHIQDYEQAYQASIADPEAFWGGVAKELEQAKRNDGPIGPGIHEGRHGFTAAAFSLNDKFNQWSRGIVFPTIVE